MDEYFHSVTLDRDKCTGCTNCLKRCPTEAIRVRAGKAHIIKERCIDCGECIRNCQNHAKRAVSDPLSRMGEYKYTIALPAPSFYGQFKNVTNIGYILAALRAVGFTAVYETSRGADELSAYIRRLVLMEKKHKPLISSACPAIVRLIQVRFPALIPHIIPLAAPVEAAAKMAREEFCKKYECAPADVGCFFISPCAAKVTAQHSPIGMEKSHLSGVFSMQDIYGPVAARLSGQAPLPVEGLAEGIGWANSGGECLQAGIENSLAVDGIYNVARVLEEIENGMLPDLDYFEGLACTGGCVGGPLTIENGFVAKNRLRKLVEKMARAQGGQKILQSADGFFNTQEIQPNPVLKLDSDMNAAIGKLEQIETITRQLPGLDCGSCGSPSCRAMAEDMVRGYAQEIDCIYKLKEQYNELVQKQKGSGNGKDETHEG